MPWAAMSPAETTAADGVPTTAATQHQRAVLVIACAVALMTVLDVSVVTVALPAVRDDLGLSTTGLQWVMNAYSLTFAGFLLLGGRAADLLGRKRVFLFGLGCSPSRASSVASRRRAGSWSLRERCRASAARSSPRSP